MKQVSVLDVKLEHLINCPPEFLVFLKENHPQRSRRLEKEIANGLISFKYQALFAMLNFPNKFFSTEDARTIGNLF